MSFNDMHVDVNTYDLNYLNMKPIVRLFDNIFIHLLSIQSGAAYFQIDLKSMHDKF